MALKLKMVLVAALVSVGSIASANVPKASSDPALKKGAAAQLARKAASCPAQNRSGSFADASKIEPSTKAAPSETKSVRSKQNGRSA